MKTEAWGHPSPMLDPKRGPRGRTNDAIGSEMLLSLELLHSRLRLRAENAIHGEIRSGRCQGSLDRADILRRHWGHSQRNVTIVNHRRSQGARDAKVSRGLRRRGPIIRVEKLILHGTHHGVLACLLEQRSERHVRVEREVALPHTREIGGELGECRARRIAVDLDHSIETAAPEGHLGATVAQMASVAWQYRHCAVVTQDSACLKNIHNRRGRFLLQIA